MKCPVCQNNMCKSFTAIVLKKHKVNYFHCAGCGLVQTEKAYWLDEAYSAAIAASDTGLVMRNISLGSKLAALLYTYFKPKESFLDISGGYGMLTRFMRDCGFDYYWEDPFCANLLARGFESDKAKKPFHVLSAFEVLEHIANPLDFIETNLKRYNCRNFIFTTELYQGQKAPNQDWWYYAFNTGQHISFYQKRTLEIIAQKLNLNFYTINGLHIFSEQKFKTSLYLKLITGRLSGLAALFIRKKLGSLSFADHLKMLDPPCA
jgi:hypothetical protein